MIPTPRDWQAIAQLQANELLGTQEGAERLAEAKRYGMLADVIEQKNREIERLTYERNICREELLKMIDEKYRSLQ